MGDVALPTPLGKAAQQANDWEGPQPAPPMRVLPPPLRPAACSNLPNSLTSRRVPSAIESMHTRF